MTPGDRHFRWLEHKGDQVAAEASNEGCAAATPGAHAEQPSLCVLFRTDLALYSGTARRKSSSIYDSLACCCAKGP